MHILSPIRSRITGVIKTKYLNEYECRLFIEHPLKNAAAPPKLFENDAIEIIAGHHQGQSSHPDEHRHHGS
jgi:type II secretory pathway predicted ATPase ExeA